MKSEEFEKLLVDILQNSSGATTAFVKLMHVKLLNEDCKKILRNVTEKFSSNKEFDRSYFSIIASLSAFCGWTIPHPDFRLGYVFLNQAVQNENALAMTILGLFYKSGVGQPERKPNYAEAIKWFNRAALHGNSNALKNLVKLYHDPSNNLVLKKEIKKHLFIIYLTAKEKNKNFLEAAKLLKEKNKKKVSFLFSSESLGVEKKIYGEILFQILCESEIDHEDDKNLKQLGEKILSPEQKQYLKFKKQLWQRSQLTQKEFFNDLKKINEDILSHYNKFESDLFLTGENYLDLYNIMQEFKEGFFKEQLLVLKAGAEKGSRDCYTLLMRNLRSYHESQIKKFEKMFKKENAVSSINENENELLTDNELIKIYMTDPIKVAEIQGSQNMVCIKK